MDEMHLVHILSCRVSTTASRHLSEADCLDDLCDMPGAKAKNSVRE